MIPSKDDIDGGSAFIEGWTDIEGWGDDISAEGWDGLKAGRIEGVGG